MNRVSTLLLLAACTTSACINPAPRTASVASALVEDTSFGSNPGKLRMYSYSPTGVPDSAPLVVALHGCTQYASGGVGAGWNELADLAKFHVVYAEQQAANNAEECFDWFTTADITRDAGEALWIKQMVDAMKAKVSIDGTRVFVTGLSAGGAMTAVMLATYPDVFAAGAVMSGVPYGCAASAVESLSCENPGVNRPRPARGPISCATRTPAMADPIHAFRFGRAPATSPWRPPTRRRWSNNGLRCMACRRHRRAPTPSDPRLTMCTRTRSRT